MQPLFSLVYLVAYGLATAGCLLGVVRARRRLDTPVGDSLAAFLAVTGAWAAVELARLAAPGFGLKVALYTVSLVVGLLSIYAWLWFCTVYADVEVPAWLTSAGVVAFVAVSVVKLTNPIHGRYFNAAIAAEPFPHLVIQFHAAHWVVTTAAYVAALVGFAVVARALAAEGRHTRYLIPILLVLFVPVLPSVASFVWPTLIPSLFYEPLGAAVFAAGAFRAVERESEAVVAPARHQLAEHLSTPVLVLDREDRVVDANDAAERVCPALADDDTPLAEAVPGLAGPDDGVVSLSTPRGDRFFLCRSTPVEVAGRVAGRTLLLTDVTELETTRRELDRQNEQLDEFAQAITHELRNPLNVALGHLRTAQRELDTTGESLDTAMAANERMVGIVDDLRAMSEYGKSISARTETDLADVAEEAWAGTDGCADLSVDASTTVSADRPRFVEMCRRAFEFCLDRGVSAVTVAPTPAGFRIETDLPPVEPSVADRLFTYGQQAADGDRMGLALVDTLAAVQGWDAQIDREAETLCFEFVSVDPVASRP